MRVEIRLSEVIGGLSYALDLTEGEPAGHAQRSCLIGMRLADDARPRRRDGALGPLLRAAAQGRRLLGQLVADDRAVRHRRPRRQAHLQARRLGAAVAGVRVGVADRGARAGPAAKVRRLLAVRDEGEVTRSLMQARCERGAQIARMLGLSEAHRRRRSTRSTSTGTARATPTGCGASRSRSARGSRTSPRRAEIFWAAGGRRAASRVAHKRRGGWFDPSLVTALDALDWSLGLERPDLTPLPAARPAADHGRRRAGPDRRRLRGRDRRQVALDLPPFRPHERDRAQHRRGARRRRRHAARPRPRGAAARHRQARRLQPDPRQAGRADRRGVRRGQGARAHHARDPRPRPRPARRGAAGRAPTTSAWTAAATRTAGPRRG